MASEDLSIIQSKAKEERTQEEQEKLACIEKLKNKKTSEQEKLEALLSIAIPEKNREIYRKRYKVNSKLIELNPNIRGILNRNTANKAIDLDER